MAQKSGVIDQSSPTGKSGGDTYPSGTGDSSLSESHSSDIPKLQFELDRTAKALANLQSERDRQSERIDALESALIEDDGEKDESDQSADFSTGVPTVDEFLQKASGDEKAKPWIDLIKHLTGKAKLDAIAEAQTQIQHAISVDAMKDFIAEKAESLKLDYNALFKELDKLAKAFVNDRPHIRARKAFALWSERKNFAEEKAKFEQERKQEQEFRESGRHLERPSNISSQIDSAKTDADWTSILSKID